MSKSKRRLVSILASVGLLLGLFSGIASAATDRDQLFGRIRSVFELVESYHKDGADLEKFVAGAIKGGLEALGDPYTNYFAPNEFANFLNSMDGSVTGIGVYLDVDKEYIIITAPIKGSPAARAGLQTGDRILAANGISLIGVPIETAQAVIRGDAGTHVVLKIERPAESRTFEVTITRETIQIPLVEYEMLEGQVAYVTITSFGSSADTEFYRAVSSLKAQGAKALIVDLRQNPGGYVSTAISIASAWVPSGSPVMYEVGKTGEQMLRSGGKLINLPTAVLVDNGSASASEILAGAIQDYGAGKLVGTKTFGKGTVQQILFMSDGGGMKVTIAEYLTAKRRHVHGIGLTPDYVVEPAPPDSTFGKPVVLKRLITVGTVGLDVLDIQQRLQFLGYDPDLNGVVGGKTAGAIRDFRFAQGLEWSAVVDNAMIERLNGQVATKLKQNEDLQLKKAIQLLTQQ